MWEFNAEWIRGLMFGIESPDVSELGSDSDVLDAVVLDLGIIRFLWIKWKETAE